jgi:predicted dehydrogenase
VGPARYGVLCVTGAQTHQENYGGAFAADPRARIVAVTDEAGVDPRRRELNAAYARRLGVPHIPDLAEALARPDVALCSICAPPDRRARIAVRCAEARKHLYFDKSLAPALEQADAIVAAVRRAGVRSHMFSLITTPWARAARDIVAGGTLGRLLAVHADCFFAKGYPGTATIGKARREALPTTRHQLPDAKRELDNIGVYPITLLRWLTGRKFATVFCATGNYFFGGYQARDVEDFGLISATLDGGIPVTLTAGRYGWRTHPAGGVTRVVLIGSERTVVVDGNRPRLEVYADEAAWQPPTPHLEDPMAFWASTTEASGGRPKRTWLPAAPAPASDASYFLDCLDAGRESELSAVEAADATEVLVAGYTSAARGEVVALPLPRRAASSTPAQEGR